MELDWSGSRYRLSLGSTRESNLLRDLLVEADYALHRLPDDEFQIRLGSSRVQLQQVVDEWQAEDFSKQFDVRTIELIRASWFEALDFFSAADFELRTGWPKGEARALFQGFLEDRRALTIRRQWG